MCAGKGREIWMTTTVISMNNRMNIRRNNERHTPGVILVTAREWRGLRVQEEWKGGGGMSETHARGMRGERERRRRGDT